MRMPRPRFTIRLIMIVVAITAVLVSGGIRAVKLARRAKHFRQLASNHANQEKLSKSMLTVKEQMLEMSKERAESQARLAKELQDYHFESSEDPLDVSELVRRGSEELKQHVLQHERDIKSSTEWIAFFTLITRYHAQLKQKYERAASHPWETVPPDPPRPTVNSRSPDPPERPAKPDPVPAKPQPRSHSDSILTAVPAFPEPQFTAA